MLLWRSKSLSSDTQRLRLRALDIYPALKSGMEALLLELRPWASNILPIAHKSQGESKKKVSSACNLSHSTPAETYLWPWQWLDYTPPHTLRRESFCGCVLQAIPIIRFGETRLSKRRTDLILSLWSLWSWHWNRTIES